MSPEVIARKLALLRQYLADLEPFDQPGAVQANHYTAERLIQLIVECMYDILSHWLSSRGDVGPDSYAEVLAEAGRQGCITADLARRLVPASKMRNLLVHGYERIDLDKIAQAIPTILEDVREFIVQLAPRGQR